MKNLLLIFSVLLSTSLSALELVKEIQAIDGFTSFASSEDGAFYDGSYVMLDSLVGVYRWYNSDDTLVRTDSYNTNSTIIYYSNNYLVFISWNQGNQIHIKSTNPNNDISFDYTGSWEVKKGVLSFTSSSNNSRLIYKLDDYSQSSSSNSSLSTIPSNAVVIPTDSSGPVQIILESSEDMVNWNSANPGTYGASTNERFFRIRAVQETE